MTNNFKRLLEATGTKIYSVGQVVMFPNPETDEYLKGVLTKDVFASGSRYDTSMELHLLGNEKAKRTLQPPFIAVRVVND